METVNSRANASPTQPIETTLRRLFGIGAQEAPQSSTAERNSDTSLWLHSSETQNLLATLEAAIVEIDQRIVGDDSQVRKDTLIVKRMAALELIQLIASIAGSSVQVSFRIQ